jgi:hypothetical protein
VERIRPARWLPVIAWLIVAAGTSSGCGGQSHVKTSAGLNRAPLESVAVHYRCPPRDALSKASPDPRTASVLVPPGPSGALICRYWGVEDPGRRPAALAGEVPVASAAVLDRLAGKLDALPAFPSPSPSCPASGGRSEVIFFHYRGAADDPVRIAVRGCAEVSNGRLVRDGLSLPRSPHWTDEGLS